MRKSIFTALAAGAVVLAGCAKIETTEVPEGRVIGFDNFVTNAVKALDTEGDGGLTTFYVYGGHTDNTTLFAGTTVSYADGAWSYSPLKYWEATKRPLNSMHTMRQGCWRYLSMLILTK